MDRYSWHLLSSFLLLLSSFLLCVFPEITIFSLANYHFYLLIALLVIDVVCQRRITLLSIWITAFIFIILSEILIKDYDFRYDRSIRFLLIANDAYILGFLLFKKSRKHSLPKLVCKNPRWLLCVIVIMYLVFLIQSYSVLIMNLNGRVEYGSGSAMGSGSLEGVFSYSLRSILPLLICYYLYRYKKLSVLWALLFCLPIFFVVLMGGARYKMLYCIAPFFVLANLLPLNKISFKNSILLILGLAFFVVSSAYLKKNRTLGVINFDLEEFVYLAPDVDDDSSISVKIAQYGSPEGIVEMTYLANLYFENHELTKGWSSGFLLYFWVPRSLWPGKPTMLDFWLPRFFNPNLSQGFSSASGFAGELRADFGIYSLFFLFLLGMLMRKADYFMASIYETDKANYAILYVVLLVPYFFFFVRSPLTASYSLIEQIIMLYIIRRLCFEKQQEK